MENLPKKYDDDTADSFFPARKPGMSYRAYWGFIAEGTLNAVCELAREYLPSCLENRIKVATVATALTLASAVSVPALYNAVTAPASKAVVTAAAASTAITVASQPAVLDRIVLDAITFPYGKNLFPAIDPNESFGIDQLLNSPKTYTLPDIKPKI